MDYKSAGVDVEAGYLAVELMKKDISGTRRPEVLGGLGAFSGAFSAQALKQMEHPVLLSATDGVGTKLKLAFILDRHDTVGMDLVAMCVNDLACAGGEPLFFLDYIACGKNEPEKIAKIVQGVAAGCRMAGAALIGGETAEHPGMMPADEYDLAGFAVGVVEESKMISGSSIKDGDVLVGLSSSGVHSNGFSLIRQIFKMDAESLNTYHEILGKSLGTELLTPTKIYTKALKAIRDSGAVIKGASHITGGGFHENIPRMLPAGHVARIDKDSFETPAIFGLIQKTGVINDKTMYGTFNMGLGMVLAVDRMDVEKVMAVAAAAGERAYKIGHVIRAGDPVAEDGLCFASS